MMNGWQVSARLGLVLIGCGLGAVSVVQPGWAQESGRGDEGMSGSVGEWMRGSGDDTPSPIDPSTHRPIDPSARPPIHLSTHLPVSRVRDRKQPATTVKQWVAQMEAAQVQVTNVKLERTETGLDITLETAEGKPLQVDATKFRQEGNNLIADIPNAVLLMG